MTDNDLRELKVCLEKLGLRVSFVSDLSVGYLRFPEGDGQIKRYTNKDNDYLVIKYPGNPNGYYLKGTISEIAKWIITHSEHLLWKNIEMPNDQTKEILEIRNIANIYQTSDGKWHVSFNNDDGVEFAGNYLRKISEKLAEKYSLRKFSQHIFEILSPDVFLYGENGIKFAILKELVRASYPRINKYEKDKLLEKYATEEGLLWAKDFVLPEAYPSNKKIDLLFPVATKLLTEDEIVDRIPSTNRIQKSDYGKQKKTQPVELPRIPTVKYIVTSENIAMAKEARQLGKKFYTTQSTLRLDERNKIVQSLWDFANQGNLEAAELLVNNLLRTKIVGIDSWPVYISDPVGRFLAEEKMLNLGGCPYNLNIFFNTDYPSDSISKEDLSELVNIGSGLAAIMKADILIAKGGNIDLAKELYRQAVMKGYSVGLRALYCIYKYEKNTDAAEETLRQFFELAPQDQTNWGRLETECDYYCETISKNKISFSMRSRVPKNAVFYLKRSRIK